MKSSPLQNVMAKRFENHQNEALKAAFEDSEHLTRDKKMELVAATGLDVEQITSWFSRKRARKRAREAMAELETAHGQLQQALQLSRGSQAKLQRELDESRKKEAELQDENQQLKQRVTIAESERQFETLMKVLNTRGQDW